jgi:hypothetical protein
MNIKSLQFCEALFSVDVYTKYIWNDYVAYLSWLTILDISTNFVYQSIPT